MLPGAIVVLSGVLLAPAEPSAAAVHLGLGFEAAQAGQAAPAQVEPAHEATEPSAPLAVLPRAGMKPPSTLDQIRHTRRARVMAVGAAVAVQGAMIVYGILSLLEQEREAEALRSAGGRPFNRYPR
ncbi:MAG: hypothetical protein AAF721_37790 [Myxococcota bacterium]